MTPTPLTLRGKFITDSHTATLAILEIALQASIESLGLRHPELRQDEPTPGGHHPCQLLNLADALDASASALLRTLRTYRTAYDFDFDF
jgi:hypothetical protein